MEFKLITGRENLNLVSYNGKLVHRNCLDDFKKLQVLAKEEIGAELDILSSFRDFSRQEIIWNNKALGKRDLLNSEGIKIDYNSLNPQQLLDSILRWSAIPGASRHHWGCDLDVYDKSRIQAKDVQLVPSESLVGGAMFELHNWLGEKIKNKESLGFFRPYDEDFGGINIEKWHLSHSPTSNPLLDSYTIDLFIKNIDQSNIELKQLILDNAEQIFDLYVKTITNY